MKNRILASLIFILSFVSFTLASTLNDSDALQLLNLVETDQDYFDAIDLIKSADNFKELSANEGLQALVLKLGNDDRSTPEWANKVEVKKIEKDLKGKYLDILDYSPENTDKTLK